jgi:hypothetical protein
VLLNSKYCLGLLCFYGGHRSLDRRPQDLSLGGKLWSWFLWEPRTVCLPMISPANGAGPLRWLPQGTLPPEMACLSTLKRCSWVWTLPQGNLSEHCNQSLLPLILSLFPLQDLFFFFFFKSLLPWQHRPIGPDLCSLQPPV